MSLKDKLTSLLFGSQHHPLSNEEDGTEQQYTAEAASENPEEAGDPNPALLELPAEHPRCRKEAGYLPTPRLCLDEDKALPADMMRRETNRLRVTLSSTCNARLKQARGKDKHGKSRRKKEEEADEPAEGEETAP